MDRGAKRNRPRRKNRPLWEEAFQAILKLAIVQGMARLLVYLITWLIKVFQHH